MSCSGRRPSPPAGPSPRSARRSGDEEPFGFESIERSEVDGRRLVRLEVGEGAAFARAVWRVAPAIERSLGPEVLANRAGHRPGTLLPWRPAWAQRGAEIARQLAEDPCPVVIVA